MSNRVYELYQKYCEELEQMAARHQGDIDGAKKLKGAVATELLRDEIGQYLKNNEYSFKVTATNVYIAGSKFEYDLLLVKEASQPYLGLVYQPEDVVAIIESKASGLFDVDTETDNIAKAVNCARSINPDIRFGYITMSENVPVNQYNNKGEETVKHWDLTRTHLDEKIQELYVAYAVTLHQGKNLCDAGSNDEFESFIEYLVSGETL